MKKWIFKCSDCETILTIETKLNDEMVHKVPPCICGKRRMDWLGSEGYKYGLPNNSWD